MNSTITLKTVKARKARTVQSAVEGLTPFDFLERIEDLMVHLEGKVLSTLESDRFSAVSVPPIEKLPDWARERLNDQGRLDQNGDEFRRNVKCLRTALQLAIDGVPKQCFEIWVNRTEPGYVTRFEGRIDTLAEARTALDLVKPEFPQAYIVQVSRRGSPKGSEDLALLDTLIGRLFIGGVFFPSGGESEDVFEVEDETGRQVNVRASVLAGHAIYQRLSTHSKAKVQHSLERAARKVGGEL